MGLNQIDEALNRALAGGPVAASTVKAMLSAAGYTDKMIRASRGRLGVAVERIGFGATTRTIWSLPALVPIADAFAPSDSAFVPSLPAFVPFAEAEALRQRLHDQIDRETAGEARAALAVHATRKAHRAEVERLSLALAAAERALAALAVPRTPPTLDDTDRVLLSIVPRDWGSVLQITSQRVPKLQNGLSVQRRLERLAGAGLIEMKAGGKQTRHGSLVQVYRLAMTGRAAVAS